MQKSKQIAIKATLAKCCCTLWTDFLTRTFERWQHSTPKTQTVNGLRNELFISECMYYIHMLNMQIFINFFECMRLIVRRYISVHWTASHGWCCHKSERAHLTLDRSRVQAYDQAQRTIAFERTCSWFNPVFAKDHKRNVISDLVNEFQTKLKWVSKQRVTAYKHN